MCRYFLGDEVSGGGGFNLFGGGGGATKAPTITLKPAPAKDISVDDKKRIAEEARLKREAEIEARQVAQGTFNVLCFAQRQLYLHCVLFFISLKYH
jgi:hypothetical protein